jgi:hypothetical protein
MKDGDVLDVGHLALAESQVARNRHRVLDHRPRVIARVGVAGLEGGDQRGGRRLALKVAGRPLELLELRLAVGLEVVEQGVRSDTF